MKLTTKTLFFIILMLSLSMSAIAGVVPDTGQSEWYNDTQKMNSRPQSGKDFYGQDASYLINPPSYTKLDAQGKDLAPDTEEWSMVRDNVTGLIWEVKQAKDEKADYGNPHDADNEYTWYNSNSETNGGNSGDPGVTGNTENFINTLNSAKFGGYSDWRLPDREELRSIADYGKYMPATDTGYFPGTASSGYWSSVTLANDAAKSWCLHFEYGLESGRGKSSEYHVRAVRGGEGEDPNPLENNDETVKDNETKLIWQKQGPESPMTWKDALAYCENLSLGGSEEWRLPTIKELASLADLSKSDPAVNAEYFPDITKNAVYWSATTYLNKPDSAWGMACDLGNDNTYIKSDAFRVRAVRGGWVSETGNLILVAGGGKDTHDPMYDSAQYLSDMVYSEFLDREFRKEDIYYFNPEPFHDIDGDGTADLIVNDDTPTVNELIESIKTWAVNQGNPGPLYLVVISHGGINTLEVYPGEIINASDLNEALTAFQNATNRDVVVITEACKSGSLVDELTDGLPKSGPNRMVITCTDEKDAYQGHEGRIAFTHFLMNQLHGGKTFADSFHDAKENLTKNGPPYSRMNPVLAEESDYSLSEKRLGSFFVIAGPFPTISEQPENREINFNTSQEFSVTISGLSTEAEVWAVVRPPDYTPPAVVEDLKAPEITLPIFDLTDDDKDSVFTGVYNDFTCNGKYSIIFYAKNDDGLISLSSPTTVTVTPLVDYNGNGSTDIGDAILGLRVIAGMGAEDTTLCGGDINEDGKIGLEEIVYILRTSAGL
ncbi:Lcl domain-containing protein [Desulfonema magnum]|nr:DUF1566 domain-containing protein [Desulfonema magnum]